MTKTKTISITEEFVEDFENLAKIASTEGKSQSFFIGMSVRDLVRMFKLAEELNLEKTDNVT